MAVGDQGGQNTLDGAALVQRLQLWARELGFSQIGISGIDLATAETGLNDWLAAGFHGSMGYMAAHGLKRARPAELVPGTVRVISVRMDYLPQGTGPDWAAQEVQAQAQPQRAVVSLYARGRDYHKVLRARLQTLADRLATAIGPFGHRVFTDSAPVMEVELATRAGLGWRGKHTLVLSREAGSMFFLGELFVDVPLPITHNSPPTDGAHCGSCSNCIDVCPTQAIVAPYRLDARRCISYLTIEHAGSIDVALRPLIGNRIYGCDDCQLHCPWNKYAQRATLPDFDTRAPLGDATLLELWAWPEDAFLRRTEGSAIRRIGYSRWRRNLAVAMGNALRAAGAVDVDVDVDVDVHVAIRAALAAARDAADDLVREHIDWALVQNATAPASQAAHARQTASHSGSATMPISVDSVTNPAV